MRIIILTGVISFVYCAVFRNSVTGDEYSVEIDEDNKNVLDFRKELYKKYYENKEKDPFVSMVIISPYAPKIIDEEALARAMKENVVLPFIVNRDSVECVQGGPTKIFRWHRGHMYLDITIVIWGKVENDYGMDPENLLVELLSKEWDVRICKHCTKTDQKHRLPSRNMLELSGLLSLPVAVDLDYIML